MTIESHDIINRSSRTRQCIVPFTLAVALLANITACGPGGAGKPAAEKKEAHAGHAHAEGEAHVHGAGHADEVVLTPDAIRRNNIRVTKVTERTLAGTLIAPARAAYNTDAIAHISVRMRGRVTDIKVRLGDSVKKDDVLLVVDSMELGEAQSDYLQKRTAIDIAKPNIELAKPAIELAQSAYDRAKQLLDERQGITLTEVQKRLGEVNAAQAALRSAEGTLRSAEAALMGAAQRLQLLGMETADVDALAKTGKLNPTFLVHAPIDGRVIARNVTLGEQASPDAEALLTLADMSTIWLLADVPELTLQQISKNAKAQITVPALGDQKFAGSVSYIQPELDPATRTARVRVEVKNPDAALLPGMFASAQINIASAYTEPVLAVPEDAVQRVEGEPAVFVPVAGEPNTYARREVGVGRAINGWVPVLAGLKKDELYVVTGSFILKAELGKAAGTHEH